MADLRCANCGAVNNKVTYYSPDMDIRPVPLCVLCAIEVMWGVKPVTRGKRKHEGGGDDE